MKALKVIFCSTAFAVVSLICSQSASAANYYVDNSAGSDNNSGTSAATAWQSIARVNSQALNPGDSVSFKRGGTWTGMIELTRSGTSGNPITITAYGSGSAPILTNPCSSCYSNIIVVRSSWIVIKDLWLKGAHHAAIIMRAGSSNVTVSDTEISNTGIGIFLQTSNHTLTRNRIHDLSMVVNNTSHPDDDYGANGFWLENADNNEISYNSCVNCRAPSYDYGMDGGFVEFWTGNNNNRIHHNWVENTHGFIEVGGNAPSSTVSNNIISYNVTYNTYGIGCFHTDGNFRTPIINMRIENNTIVTQNVEGYRMLDCISPTPEMLVFRNNIVYAQIQVASSGNFVHENNLYYLPSGAPLGYALGPGEKMGNPLFANLNGKDLHLQSASPARNAGQNLGYSLDYDNQSVPQGGAPDIGAFETAGGGTPVPTTIPTATLTPRPSSTPVPTPTGTPIPTTTPGPGAAVVTIYAAGSKAGTIWPTMQLTINDQVVASWDNVQGNFGARQFSPYAYVHPTGVTPSQVKVHFINDALVDGEDGNLHVDRITIGSTSFQTEDPSTYSVGSYSTANGCGEGYKSSETLHCNGYFQYAAQAVPTATPTPTNTTKPGDGNNDGKVDGIDYVVWLNNFGITTSSGAAKGDYNKDTKVDGIDYVLWLNNFGK